MGLLKVQAGILNLSLELTALFMPLIGRIADRKDIRKFMVFTPLVTALCMSMLGVIPNFYLLFLVLTIGGVSIYFYHAIGPADIAKVNDAALGRLMAIWNIAGQIAFMIGPSGGNRSSYALVHTTDALAGIAGCGCNFGLDNYSKKPAGSSL